MVERVLVSVTDRERQLLLERVQLRPRIRAIVESARKGARGWGITVAAKDAGEIRDCCGTTLAAIGFDEHYAPTRDGLLLESMIDKFFTG